MKFLRLQAVWTVLLLLYEAEQTLFIWAKRNFPPVLLRIILTKTSLKRRFVTAIFIR